MDICQCEKHLGGRSVHRRAEQPPQRIQQRKSQAYRQNRLVSPRGILSCDHRKAGMGAGTGVTQVAGPPRKRQSGQAPLRGVTDLPGMWEYVHSYDPLLERQEPCGICMPWIPPEWKTYCASHRIHEETLDARVWELVSTARESRTEELKKLAQMQKMWALRKPVLDAHILSLQGRVLELEKEIDEIVMEKIKCQI